MSSLSPRQMFLLDLACKPIAEGLDTPYLVGTAAELRQQGAQPRDVDVRVILADSTHDRLRRAIGRRGIALMGMTIGQYLASMTGLPIDFQIQRMTEANALHGGKARNPLGTRSLREFRGDAQTADMAALYEKVEAEKAAAHDLAEAGRQLASERDDLIADGINPADLLIPLHPAALSPDCRDGKHRACRGEAFDVQADKECPCACACHQDTNAAETLDGTANAAA